MKRTEPSQHQMTMGWGGSLCFVSLALCVVSIAPVQRAFAGDGATESLELRLHAELAIAEEHAEGEREFAEAMHELLPGLLSEYLASRDETIALDVVDTAFVREQFEVAQLLKEPGLAWALDVFAGPGTGYEHGLQMALSNLADFHEERASRATEAALKVYERERQQRRLEKLEELDKDQTDRLDRFDAKLARASDRAALAVTKAGDKALIAAENVAKAANRVADNVAKAADKAVVAAENVAKAAEKVEENVTKAADVVEPAPEPSPEPAPEPAPKADPPGQSKDKPAPPGGSPGNGGKPK